MKSSFGYLTVIKEHLDDKHCGEHLGQDSERLERLVHDGATAFLSDPWISSEVGNLGLVRKSLLVDPPPPLAH